MESRDSSLKDWFRRTGREALILAARLVGVILPVVAAGILLLLLFLQNTTVHLVVFGFTTTVCLGLLGGFLARWILKEKHFRTALPGSCRGFICRNGGDVPDLERDAGAQPLYSDCD